MTPTLPVHHYTRLTAIGRRRDGSPIWPVKGGAPEGDPPADPPADPPEDPPADPPADDKLGDPGKAALTKEREARKQAERELAKYRKADQERAEAEKSEAEKRAAAEERATAAELKATKLEVAAEKGLTPAQAKRLVGSTREELEADADDILENFPASPAKPKTPAPDPSQGPKGTPPNTRPTSLGQAVAGALKKA